ncbi:glycosyltransferase family 4 protein [Flavisolibacter ginsenosidimutans]|uniref:Glycosyltransferase family 4 protein n=1 Tax=Flavisolibacter ginsenosidimutans TaxID=661481 RepID=A0A5B8UE79_9BACT|nr:glycosyltransferase family 4 protein [Flavisolibacter ginsenosidimutans]QEC54874.1 glycosyltransferase family 4 protein [Flavisolibacter ginsenosidimutans]
MRLLILDQNYPHLENLMGDVFVHVRAKEYAKRHEVKVFSYFQEPSEIVYEGISLQRFDNVDALAAAVKEYKADKILIHFYQPWMLEKIIRQVNVPVIIWVHLFEAIGWYRRLFNYTLYSPVFFRFVLKNIRQQYRFRQLINYANRTSRIRFVFVSDWIRRTAEKDTLTKIKAFDVIPNPVDISLFAYRPKNDEQRKKVLVLRSFDSRKYANDVYVKGLLLLSKKKAFQDFTFTIIGKGPLFEKTLAPLRLFKNIEITNGAVRQVLIPALHEQYGVFLCPTRQDSHGVSMCEAMASGLVPIASNNSAIPEYVEHNKSGYLTNNSAQQIAGALEELLEKPDKFLQMSKSAAEKVRERCNIENISKKELAIIES